MEVCLMIDHWQYLYSIIKPSAYSSSPHKICLFIYRLLTLRGRRDRMVVRFTTTCTISAYHH